MPEYQIRWSPHALNELDRLRVFLKNKSPTASKKAIHRIKDAVKVLHQNPKIGTEYDKTDNRRELYLSFGKDNYMLRYRVHDTEKYILILRAYHGREKRN